MSAPIAVINRNLVRNISLCLRKTAPSKCLYLGRRPWLHCTKLLPVSSVFQAPDSDRRMYSVDNQKNSETQNQASGEIPETDQQEAKDEEEEYEHKVREKILAAAMNHIIECGWTQEAIEAGAQDEGLSEAANGMFDRGGAEIISYFYRKCNQELVDYMKQQAERIEAEGLEKPKTGAFIQDAVETRLKLIIPYHKIWKEAMAIQTLPQNAPESWQNLSDLCDDIWYYAGDRSTDFDWYTKRFSLAAIYKATEIYMLQDTSPDFADTWIFLSNRLKDIQNLGSVRRSLGPISEGIVGLIKMGRNILGMNSRNR